MIITQISDTHLSRAHPQRTDNLVACVAHINAQAKQPDVVIHTGDITHDGTEEEYADALHALAPLKAPLFAIPGNRDNREIMGKTFADYIPQQRNTPFLQYAVNRFPVRIICLDTLSEASNKGQLCPVRFADVLAMLQQDTNTPTAIFTHHPPFEASSSRDPFQFEQWDIAEKLMAAFIDAPNVFGLFCGHVHRPNRKRIGSLPVTTMTSIALDLRVGDDPDKTDMRPRYDIHVFDTCGEVTSQSIIADSNEHAAS